MKKAVLPRFAGLMLVYAAVICALIVVQFSRQGSFTQRMGSLIVTGSYAEPGAAVRQGGAPEAGEVPQNGSGESGGEYTLSGEAAVFFGGMEFRLSGGDGFILERNGEEKLELYPEAMTMTGNSAKFRFQEGFSLEFATNYSGGNQELTITCDSVPGTARIELPFRPQRSPRGGKDSEGDIVVVSSGLRYTFMNSRIDAERRIVTFAAEAPRAYYSVIPEEKAFAPGDYTLAEARTERDYNDAILRWRDETFSLWNRTADNNLEEDRVAAYLGEAVHRGVYKSAVASIPASFRSSAGRTYRSSVYLGRLDIGLETLRSYAREYLARVSQLIKEKSPEILKEVHIFYNLAIFGANVFVEDGAELVRSFSPPALSLDQAAGVFEGWLDWNAMYPQRENPFNHLVDQAWFLVSGAVQKPQSGDMVVLVQNGEADTRYSLLLGHSLASYAAKTGKEDWAGVGRSLVLSVLNLSGDSGSVPQRLRFDEGGGLQNTAENRIPSAQLYNLFRPGHYNARGVDIPARAAGLWAFTAAEEVSAVETAENLSIAVSFPAGETHYMIIRGVKPFSKIQLYDMDYRTDPNFERYDSSGWAYSRADQTLMVKMKHKANIEYIRIFFQNQ